MKLLQISVHFEYAEAVDKILDRHVVTNYLRYPMIEGRDEEGKHFGTQVFPGNFTGFQVQVADEQVDEIFDDLREFREQKRAHNHLQALVLPVEKHL